MEQARAKPDSAGRGTGAMCTAMRRAIRGTVLALAVGMAGASGVAAQDGVLSVTGTGEVRAAPDAAELRLSVQTVAPDAAEAMGTLTGRLDAVMAALDAAGVAPAEMQSTDLSLQPVYAPRSGPQDDRPPRIDGYRARTGLLVQVAPLEALGGIVDTALEAGANGFEGVRFVRQIPGPLLELARERAVADALDRAQTYAAAAGVALGDIVEIREGGGGGGPRPAGEMRMAAEVLNLAPGELTFGDSVTVVFRIAPPLE